MVFVHGDPAVTKDADDIDMRQRVANVQAEARLPRLVSGQKQKDNILEKYQAQYGNGKDIVASFKGKIPKTSLQPPSQHELMKSCRMKPDRNKSYSMEDPTIFNIWFFSWNIFVKNRNFSFVKAKQVMRWGGTWNQETFENKLETKCRAQMWLW